MLSVECKPVDNALLLARVLFPYSVKVNPDRFILDGVKNLESTMFYHRLRNSYALGVEVWLLVNVVLATCTISSLSATHGSVLCLTSTQGCILGPMRD